MLEHVLGQGFPQRVGRDLQVELYRRTCFLIGSIGPDVDLGDEFVQLALEAHQIAGMSFFLEDVLDALLVQLVGISLPHVAYPLVEDLVEVELIVCQEVHRL